MQNQVISSMVRNSSKISELQKENNKLSSEYVDKLPFKAGDVVISNTSYKAYLLEAVRLDIAEAMNGNERVLVNSSKDSGSYEVKNVKKVEHNIEIAQLLCDVAKIMYPGDDCDIAITNVLLSLSTTDKKTLAPEVGYIYQSAGIKIICKGCFAYNNKKYEVKRFEDEFYVDSLGFFKKAVSMFC